MKKIIVKITNVNILVKTSEQKVIDRIYSYNTIMELEEFEIASISKNIKIDCCLEIYNSINLSKCCLEKGIIKLYCDIERLICSSTIRSILFILADKKRQEKIFLLFMHLLLKKMEEE